MIQPTNTALELAVRAPGTHRVKMAIRGNALLSSVYITSADPGATLKVIAGLDHYSILTDGGPQIVYAVSQMLEG